MSTRWTQSSLALDVPRKAFQPVDPHRPFGLVLLCYLALRGEAFSPLLSLPGISPTT